MIEGIKYQRFDNLGGGIFSDASPTKIFNFQTPDARNIRITQDTWTNRKGITQYGDTLTGGGIDNGLFPYLRDTASGNVLVRGYNSGLYYDLSETWTAISNTITVDDPIEAISFDDNLYVLNGTDELGQLNGTTYTEPTTGIGAGYKYLRVFKKMMWMGGLSTNPSVIVHSRLVDAANPTYITTFTGGEAGSDFLPGSGITTGIEVAHSRIYFFKENSIFYATTIDATTYIPDTEVLTELYGAVGQRAITKVGNDIFVFTGNSVISIGQQANYTDPRTSTLSDPINDFIRNGLHADQSLACSSYNPINGLYKLYVRSLNGTTNDTCLVYDTINKNPKTKQGQWMIDEQVVASSSAIFANQEYIGSAHEGITYKSEDDYSDDDTFINSYRFTKKWDYDRAIFREIRLSGYIGEATTLTVEVYVDDVLVSTVDIDQNDISYSTPGALGTTVFGDIPFGSSSEAESSADGYFQKRISFRAKGRFIQLKFLNEGEGQYHEVEYMEIGGIPVNKKEFAVKDTN